jgi:hypothetical protein
MKHHFDKNDEPLKIIPTETSEYWLVLKNKSPVQPTLMNVHQIVENSRFLEEKLENQEKIIEEQQMRIFDLERKMDTNNNLVFGLLIKKNSVKGETI